MIKQAQAFSLQHFGQLLFQNRKKAGIYGLFFVIISFNLSLFLQANTTGPAGEKIANAIQLACFFMMGIINVWFFYKRRFLDELSVSGAKPAYIFLLFIVIALVLFFYYFISGSRLIMAFASSSAFLLPFLIYQGWRAFISIPHKTYPIWMLPAPEFIKANAALSTLNTMQVQIKIQRMADDLHDNTFPLTVSGKLKLGKAFERFITEQNFAGHGTSIEISDGDRQSYGWQFYEQKLYGLYTRNLNPAMSLIENNIKPNAAISVIRVAHNTCTGIKQ